MKNIRFLFSLFGVLALGNLFAQSQIVSDSSNKGFAGNGESLYPAFCWWKPEELERHAPDISPDVASRYLWMLSEKTERGLWSSSGAVFRLSKLEYERIPAAVYLLAKGADPFWMPHNTEFDRFGPRTNAIMTCIENKWENMALTIIQKSDRFAESDLHKFSLLAMDSGLYFLSFEISDLLDRIASKTNSSLTDTERADRNAAANELYSIPELPDGGVGDLARMSASPDEDEVWRDYCRQFLGSTLERPDGVTDADRALARETLVEALASTNASFAGAALRALHRGDPSDPVIASNALRTAPAPSN